MTRELTNKEAAARRFELNDDQTLESSYSVLGWNLNETPETLSITFPGRMPAFYVLVESNKLFARYAYSRNGRALVHIERD